jgi:hypothetical protein
MSTVSKTPNAIPVASSELRMFMPYLRVDDVATV